MRVRGEVARGITKQQVVFPEHPGHFLQLQNVLKIHSELNIKKHVSLIDYRISEETSSIPMSLNRIMDDSVSCFDDVHIMHSNSFSNYLNVDVRIDEGDSRQD